MHDGYAGDHKDYYKFLILKSLAQHARLKISVCWMLTRPGSGNDDTKYLEDEKTWVRRPECEDIFKKFKACVKGSPPARTVADIQGLDLIPGANYFSMLYPTRSSQNAYWEEFDRHLEEYQSDLIFFDPNTGLSDIASQDHLSFDRLRHYKQCSLMVIQFPGQDKHIDPEALYRKSTEVFVEKRAGEIVSALKQEGQSFDDRSLWCFWCRTLRGKTNVFFYLIVRTQHIDRMTPVVANLKGLWKGCRIERRTGIQDCFTVIDGKELLRKGSI